MDLVRHINGVFDVNNVEEQIALIRNRPGVDSDFNLIPYFQQLIVARTALLGIEVEFERLTHPSSAAAEIQTRTARYNAQISQYM